MTQQRNSAGDQTITGQTAVIFLHIPKTAGTTLLEILDRQYPPETVYSFGADAHESTARFKALDDPKKMSIRLLRGHMAYGLHDYLPGRVQYFTLLREPVSRVISYYNFIRRTPDHYLYDRVVGGNLTLQALLEQDYALMLNDAQVRLISGVWGDAPFGEVTPGMLESARKNLADSFAVVGLTEQFDKTVLLLKETFHWPGAITYRRRNVSQEGMTAENLPRETLDLIREVNQQDQALYNFGRQLFKKQCARQGPGFNWRVRYFQYVNQYGPTIQRLRTFSVRAKMKGLVEG